MVPVPEEMRAFCGKNAQMASNELGLQIRRMCPIQGFKVSWKSVDPAIKESISQAVLDKFDIVDAFENRALAKEVTNEKAYLLYKNWKCKMRLYYLKLVEDGYDAYSHPYTGVTLDEWKYLIDHVFHDPDLEERRIAGKANRSKLGPGHTMGSRSIPAEMTIHAEENDGDLPDFCDLYEKAHTLKNIKQWIDPRCRERHAEMKRVRDEAKQNGTPLTHEEISGQCLGRRRGAYEDLEWAQSQLPLHPRLYMSPKCTRKSCKDLQLRWTVCKRRDRLSVRSVRESERSYRAHAKSCRESARSIKESARSSKESEMKHELTVRHKKNGWIYSKAP